MRDTEGETPVALNLNPLLPATWEGMARLEFRTLSQNTQKMVEITAGWAKEVLESLEPSLFLVAAALMFMLLALPVPPWEKIGDHC